MVELTFDSDNSRRCAEFNIKEDGVTEGLENFMASLTSSDMVNLDPNKTTIQVCDADSKYITLPMSPLNED